MAVQIPTYLDSIPTPDRVKADISRLFTALQAARKLLKLSQKVHGTSEAIATNEGAQRGR